MLVDRYGNNVQDYEIVKAGRVTCSYYSAKWLRGSVSLGLDTTSGFYAIVSIVYVDGTAITQTENVTYEISNGSLVIWAQGNYVSGHLLDVSYQIVKSTD
ncbi:MAG: hypothetical protein E7189_06585 [Erysipelotrichaceae bacterium]|nr:hypothetical protein [Erysipelotrichaceae bacterium]